MYETLPTRIKLLLISAYLECASIFAFEGLIFYRTAKQDDWELLPIIINAALITPFLLNAVLVITMIRNYFPSKELNLAFKIVLVTTILITSLCQLLAILGTIASMLEETNHNRNTNPVFIAFLTLIYLVLTLQLYNNIEGLRVSRIIRRNRRNELVQSF